MKLGSLQPGMTVYDIGRYRMGNTTLTSVCVYKVRVLEIDAERERVKAAWNCNEFRWYPKHIWRKWRLKEPKLVSTGMFGQKRLARRGDA